MRSRCLATLIAGLQLIPWSTVHAETPEVQDRSGLSCISRKAFSVPEGSKFIPEFTVDFESGRTLPKGWSQGNGEVVTAADAPQGKAYLRMKAKKSSILRGPTLPAQPGGNYFLSFSVKTAKSPWAIISFTSDEREPSFGPLHSPISYQKADLDTGDQWRQLGYYFAVPAQCKTIQLSVNPTQDGPDGQFFSIDDVRLRTVSDAEMAAAYANERANYPAYDPKPQPRDGKNLALSVAKWEGRARIPGKPFVIWALGSSFTAWQGDGNELIRAIRQRFPHAPPIIYRRHGGPGTPWEFVYAWIKQFVAVEEPDLIFTYTGGSLEGLDAMLTEIRRNTTAEIIVPTLHCKPDSPLTPEFIEHGAGIRGDKVREICAKHGVEFVENRHELADYVAQHKLTADDLLADHNHQGMHGRIRIWDNVIRHLVKSDQPSYTPESRERRISVTAPLKTATEEVSFSANWTTTHGVLHTSTAGAKLQVTFTGNKIALLGRKLPSGGSVKVSIDGVPGDQAPVFYTNFIKPKKAAWRIPHVVDLGKDLVPQTWTITMTSDTGDYSLGGSVTGPDGAGNLAQPFTSNSGQVSIDPRYWREGRNTKKDGTFDYGNAKGDSFSFDVFRGALGYLSFKGDQGAVLVEPLAQHLLNGPHTLELVATSDGEVTIEGLYVFQPPLSP